MNREENQLLIKYKQELITNYILKNENGDTFATTKYPFPSETEYLANSKGIKLQRLSFDNCQAIERGYDLDGVVEDIVKTIVPDDRGEDIWYGTSMAIGKLCFQKALELLGDKIFTLDDIYTVFIMGREGMEDKMNRYVTRIHEPTEWDVEIEMEYIGECNGNNGDGCFQDSPGHNCGCFERKPKLDSKGCLILKSKK